MTKIGVIHGQVPIYYLEMDFTAKQVILLMVAIVLHHLKVFKNKFITYACLAVLLKLADSQIPSTYIIAL